MDGVIGLYVLNNCWVLESVARTEVCGVLLLLDLTARADMGVEEENARVTTSLRGIERVIALSMAPQQTRPPTRGKDGLAVAVQILNFDQSTTNNPSSPRTHGQSSPPPLLYNIDSIK